jgi:hypothetical protein
MRPGIGKPESCELPIRDSLANAPLVERLQADAKAREEPSQATREPRYERVH